MRSSFYGHDGLDELTTTTTSTVIELRDGDVDDLRARPGGARSPDRRPRASSRAATPPATRQVAHRVLAGQHGPVRDIAALNAAAALVVAGVADDVADGLERAFVSIDDGHAAAALDALVRTSVAAHEDGI